MGEMYAAPFTIERGRAALAAILSAFETPPHLGNWPAAVTCSFISSDIHDNTFMIFSENQFGKAGGR